MSANYKDDSSIPIYAKVERIETRLCEILVGAYDEECGGVSVILYSKKINT